MAIDRTPVLKRCRQLGIDPAELGYSSKKESIRQPKRRRKESEYLSLIHSSSSSTLSSPSGLLRLEVIHVRIH